MAPLGDGATIAIIIVVVVGRRRGLLVDVAFPTGSASPMRLSMGWRQPVKKENPQIAVDFVSVDKAARAACRSGVIKVFFSGILCI